MFLATWLTCGYAMFMNCRYAPGIRGRLPSSMFRADLLSARTYVDGRANARYFFFNERMRSPS